jgi:tetratricopeptide (TPR) repeat protein
MTYSPTPSESARLEHAARLAREGRPGQAIGVLRSLIADAPDLAEAHYQLALALDTTGDRVGAERALRDTLAKNPASSAAATRLATSLGARRQWAEAAETLRPFLGTPAADTTLLSAYGLAQKGLGRLEAAIPAYQNAVAAAPASGAAEHNLAGVLAEAHRFAESEAATQRAFSKGLDAPETWVVRGRALRGLRRFEEAESAFREAIRRRPDYADAFADLAQLVWMRTEDLGLARADLDRALAARPLDGGLGMALSKLLEYAGDRNGALQALVGPLEQRGTDPALLVSAALLLIDVEPNLAISYAQRAVAAAPENGQTRAALCQANLALGRADEAARIAVALCRDWPLDQYPVALAATAWRLLGDSRYRDLYDYDRLVRAQSLEAPPGWPNLETFLSDLADRLGALQSLRGHPVGQSLRGGAQTEQSLALSTDPIIAAFFRAIDTPIRDYIDVLRSHDDVLGRRVTESYRFTGAWSALLRPGGFHVNHLHPMGWISSACHIVVPGAIARGHEGWLQFGEPGVTTHPHLPAEHFVKPKPGTLVLFPSYMWHGTVPFAGAEPRLTVAFDVLPD